MLYKILNKRQWGFKLKYYYIKFKIKCNSNIECKHCNYLSKKVCILLARSSQSKYSK